MIQSIDSSIIDSYVKVIWKKNNWLQNRHFHVSNWEVESLQIDEKFENILLLVWTLLRNGRVNFSG